MIRSLLALGFNRDRQGAAYSMAPSRILAAASCRSTFGLVSRYGPGASRHLSEAFPRRDRARDMGRVPVARPDRSAWPHRRHRSGERPHLHHSEHPARGGAAAPRRARAIRQLSAATEPEPANLDHARAADPVHCVGARWGRAAAEREAEHRRRDACSPGQGSVSRDPGKFLWRGG
jgi:hypothetical protein